MERFLFDYIYDRDEKIVINELICGTLDDAIAFIDKHYLELHTEGETEISAIRLRTGTDEIILSYEMQADLAGGGF